MITPAFLRIMSTYNGEMNRRLYQAAEGMSDEERKRDRGAFWTSIHGTFNHLLWVDMTWMSRFSDWPKPSLPLAESHRLHDDFAQLAAARRKADADLVEWASHVDQDWLDAEQSWFSGAAQRDVRGPRKLLLAHLFNHQTHHRGQAHAMLTAAGRSTGDTDLWLVVPKELRADL